MSGRGSSASEHMFCIPGDSPMGFRLPLDSLPWSRPGGPRRRSIELDPIGAARPAAAADADTDRQPRSDRETDRADAAHGRTARPHGLRGQSDPALIRTGLCVEPRDGRLHVFMPPQRLLEDYLDLVAAVEETAAELRPAGADRGLHAAARPPAEPLQGDARPRRHRGQHPPGPQLGGAGREHHDPLRGGAADAAGHRKVHARRPPHRHRRRQPHRPRRPDAGRQPDPAPARPAAQPARLLAQPSVAVVSLLGMFIGPTSQAPRVDEARNDSLYELEIAFRQIPEQRRPPALAGRPRLPPPAHRRDRQHAPGGVLHRQALLARRAAAAASAWSSCAPSRCRRTPA